MMKDVPNADVVIVNPTHIAIAIKYDPTVAPAPIVLAIGQRKIAERIKAIAIESGVPIVQNKPLARALLKTAKVGTLIPYELYMAVAEVLAFVLPRPAARVASWRTGARSHEYRRRSRPAAERARGKRRRGRSSRSPSCSSSRC